MKTDSKERPAVPGAPSKTLSKKQEQSARTRAALLSAARSLFAEKGFAGTATEEVVARAGLSRGALYHQFQDKTALFRAVFEAVEQDLMARIAKAVEGPTDPVESIHRGAELFLEICAEPEVRRIALLDAPSVLGWQVWRELDAKYALGLIRAVLQQLADEGRIDPPRVDDLAHLVLGALSEAAMVVAHAPGDRAARERVGRSLRWMLERLLGGGSRIARS